MLSKCEWVWVSFQVRKMFWNELVVMVILKTTELYTFYGMAKRRKKCKREGL